MIVLLLIFLQSFSFSQEKEYKIEDEVLVIGQRTPYNSQNSLISVEVIDSKEISKIGIQSVSDILELSSSLDIRNRGKSGTQADISLRGSSFNQTLIMIDGIPVNDPQTGHHNMNLTITPEMIDRIEIVKSGSSKSSGVNSFAGTINIITKETKNNNLGLTVEGGEFGYANLDINLSNKYGKFSNYLNISGNRSDGFVDNTDHQTYNFYLKSNYDLSDNNDLFMTLSYVNREFGAQSFYTPAYPNQFEQTRTILANIGANFNNKISFTPNVFFRLNYDRFELYRNFENAASWYSDHNYHLSNIVGTNGNLSYESMLGKSSLGYEFKNESINSTVLGEQQETTTNNPFDNTDFTKYKSRFNSTIFIENNYQKNNLLINAGLSLFNNSDYGTYLNPGLDIGYLFDNIKLFANYNRSTRIPTFTELYYSGPTNLGNPDLKPEISDNFEVGTVINKGNIRFETNLFSRYGKDLIDWNRPNDSTKWQSNNYTNINFLGVESSLAFDNIYQSDDFKISKVKLSAIYLSSDLKESDFDSYYVLDHLTYKFNLLVILEIFKDLNIAFDINNQQRNGSFQRFISSTESIKTNYDPIYLANLKVNYKIKEFNLYLNITNLFDQDYFDIANVPVAGRWTTLGIKYNIMY